MSNKILAATSKCASVAGHFDGRAEALKQYMRHRPMQHVHSYIGSHWVLPLGNYLLRIAPVAAMATIENNDAKCTHFAGHFDGHCDAAVLYRVHCLMEEVRGFHKSH